MAKARVQLVRVLLGCALTGVLLGATVSGEGAPARADGEPPAPAPSAATRALDSYFRGEIVGLKGKDIAIRYDFSQQEQLLDWKEGVPWPIAKLPDQGIAWFDERLEVRGNSGARHVAEWAGEVWVTCTLTLDGEKDMGGYLVPADEGDSYAAFALMETFFHAWDNSEGKQHTVMKFGKQWREAGSTSDFVGFRYVNRRPPPTPPRVGDVVPFAFGVEQAKLAMVTGEVDLRGKDPGKKFTLYRPGFYAIRARILVDDVTIRGRLSDEWLAAEKIELRTEKPVYDPASGVPHPAVAALIAGYADKRTPAAALVKVVGDPGASKPSRAGAAQALGSGPRVAVRAVLDLLYRTEVESRAYGIGIVKALLGKDFGYSPKGSEEQRSEAIRRLNEELKKSPSLLDGP